MRQASTIAAFLFFLAAAAPLAARCALCRGVAAVQNAIAPGVIDTGIVVLFLPAVTVFSGVLFLAFRYRSQGGDPGRTPSELGDDERG
jgi:hypothetical protein